MARRALFAAALLAAAAVAREPLLKITLKARAEGYRVFVDAAGRERFFHGVNTVVKGPPWYPSRAGYDPYTSVVADDFKMMQDAGVNWIRLGAMWPGVEPEKGSYNQTYLRILRDISEEAATFGIYTLADMHQDVLSERYCGEGVPRWVTPEAQPVPFPIPLQATGFGNDPETGFPSRKNCATNQWPAYYGTEAAGEAFEKLYTDLEAVDAWAGFWGQIAALYNGSAALLGYELINEPYVGNPYTDPELLLPGIADERRLEPAFAVLNTRIRSIDADGLIFFAGATWDRTGGAIVDDLPWGFKEAPGGAEFADRSVSAFHYYTPPQKEGASLKYFESRLKDAKRWGTGFFLTESDQWAGGTDAFANAESMGVSWGAWEWKDFCKETNETVNSSSQDAAWGACKTGYGGIVHPTNGTTTATNLYSLARTYARAVAGTFLRASFDFDTSVYTVTYQTNPAIKLPTEIFFYPPRYRGKPNITIDPPGALAYTFTNNTVLLHPAAARTDDVTSHLYSHLLSPLLGASLGGVSLDFRMPDLPAGLSVAPSPVVTRAMVPEASMVTSLPLVLHYLASQLQT
eukprot:gene1197-1856_t